MSMEPPPIAAGRARVLARVADGIERLRGPGILRVAVDGVDGAGKTTFADELAVELRRRERGRTRVGGRFHHRAAVRHRRGRRSPEGFFEDSYDYDAFRALVLEPLGPGGSVPWKTGPRDPRSHPPTEPCAHRTPFPPP